ncbi:hypothetical protein V2J09_021206 [Rumex salicifolius]
MEKDCFILHKSDSGRGRTKLLCHGENLFGFDLCHLKIMTLPPSPSNHVVKGQALADFLAAHPNPDNEELPDDFPDEENCTSNVAEYEALIIGLEITQEIHADPLMVFGDSQLTRAKYLIGQFYHIDIDHVSKSENAKANSLAKLAASLILPGEREIQVTVGERHLLAPVLEQIDQVEEVKVVSVYESMKM